MEAFAVNPVVERPAVRLLSSRAVRSAHGHRRDPDELPFGVCRACGRPWPCDTARLLAVVAADTKKTPEGTSVP
jgi:hypothetical protein